MKVILICGAARSGKDTAADAIIQNQTKYNVIKIALADPIKRMAAEIYGWPVEYVWEKKDDPDPAGRVLPDGTILTGRKALQILGTEGAKTVYKDVWSEYLSRSIYELSKPMVVNGAFLYKQYDKYRGIQKYHYAEHVKEPIFIVSDVRYFDEYKYLSERFTVCVLEIKRKKRKSTTINGVAGHSSENLDWLETVERVTINNNGTKSDFEESVVTTVSTFMRLT